MQNSCGNKAAAIAKSRLAVLVALGMTLATGHARAQSLVTDGALVSDGTSTPTGTVPLPIAHNMTAAGEFTLSADATLTSAVLSLAINTAPLTLSDLSVEILGSTSDFPNSTVYASSAGDSGTLGGVRSAIGFGFASPILAAGTYWLELFNSSTNGGIVNWTIANPPTNTGTDGTVNNLALFNGSAVSSAEIFALEGSLAPAPEPAVVGLFATGIAAIAMLRRKHAP